MSVEIKVPTLPESVTEGTLGSWLKNVGDPVSRDEHIVDLETDKVVLEIVATDDGVLDSIQKQSGDTVTSDQVLGTINTDSAAQPVAQPPKQAEQSPQTLANVTENVNQETAGVSRAGPAARKLLKQNDLNLDDVKGSGDKGTVTRDDVKQHLSIMAQQQATPTAAPGIPLDPDATRGDRRVAMSRLRQRIAERLKEAQNTAAMLTTFNEVDLKPMMDIRARYKDSFEKTHSVKLGMMSFFTRAAVEALKKFPAVNASVDGSDVVYHDYFDIGIAVSSERGLVVPVLRDADQMSFAEIESQIRELAIKARDGKLGIEDLTGGTFSITNGGVFGSMLSTPILNPPQSAILGMHKIQDRPVVVDGEIVIRPVMYLALTYDHRIIDGREAVQFLVSIKNAIEDPASMLLQL